MNIIYNPGTDLLYLRINEIVLDIGEGEKIVGIEIMNASNR